jgi:hypothetical protein
MKDQLVSRLALAKELNVEPQTIAKWVRAGWFPKPAYDPSDRLILYRRDQVDAALKARQRSSMTRGTSLRRKG